MGGSGGGGGGGGRERKRERERDLNLNITVILTRNHYYKVPLSPMHTVALSKSTLMLRPVPSGCGAARTKKHSSPSGTSSSMIDICAHALEIIICLPILFGGGSNVSTVTNSW